jgi:hypothetical protein
MASSQIRVARPFLLKRVRDIHLNIFGDDLAEGSLRHSADLAKRRV